MSNPVIFIRKWIGEVKILIEFRFHLRHDSFSDVFRHFEFKRRTLSLGSVFHDEMEHRLHRTRSESDSLSSS